MELVSPEDSRVFEPEGVHQQLYIQRERMAGIAGIAPHWLWQPLGDFAGHREVTWAKRFRYHAGNGDLGILYVGDHPGVRLDALVGTMCRVEVDARLVTVRHALRDPDAQDADLLVLPDFCVDDVKAPAWKVDGVAELLLERASALRQTVVYAPSLEALQATYGAMIADHVTTKFLCDPR